MSIKYPDIKMMGERAILIEFEPRIDEITLEKVLRVREILISQMPKEEVEVINTYHSLLIIYHSTIEDAYSEVLKVKVLLEETNIDKITQKKIYHIPVCYDINFGWDIEQISVEKKLPVEEVIRLHSASIYTVYFIGFLPGFLYLGGLHESLHFPRKNEPRLEVPKGAVGIGGNQTGIYPKNSPGGWQIIGNSPINFFDKNEHPPCQFSAGDKVKFYPVSGEEYSAIKNEVGRGKFQLKSTEFHD